VLPRSEAAPAEVDALLAARGAEVVTNEGWLAIDAVERERGARQGRPRVKICSRDDLLAAARSR
jgi:ferredoxin--NADP+ reductase